MFLNTIGVTEKFVRIALKKKKESGIPSPDRRGKHPPINKLPEEVKQSVKAHIMSFPTYESHYSRAKTTSKYLGPELNISIMYRLYKEKCVEEQVPDNMIAKPWLYSKIFNEQFNLRFYQPSTDTCDDCDYYIKALKETNSEDEKEKIKKEQLNHHQEAELRYELKRNDKVAGKNSNGDKMVVMMDLQKCLPTPCLTNSRSFYLRKLWTLNLTIHCDTTGQSYCLLWDETKGQRGGNEIASCIIKWAQQNITEQVQELTIWSDNCSGQNRNKMIILAYMWLLNKTPNLKVINHKYLLKGHTHLEADTVHAIIERKRKSLKTLEIEVPRDWAQFISTCKNTNPFVVISMDIEDFRDMTCLSKGANSPLVYRSKDSTGGSFYLSQVVWIQVKKENPGILYYKTSFNESDFKSVNFKRRVRFPIIFPDTIPAIRSTTIPIKLEKYQHLQTLLTWVDKSFHTYYKSIKYSTTAPDQLIDDDESE
nr:unnamed protein product [Callosobruchus chinensis]